MKTLDGHGLGEDTVRYQEAGYTLCESPVTTKDGESAAHE